MATYLNDMYTKEPRDLGFVPCVDEFIKEHWNDEGYTICANDYPLGNSFSIYDEDNGCVLKLDADGKCVMSMRRVLAPTPLMDLFVKLRGG